MRERRGEDEGKEVWRERERERQTERERERQTDRQTGRQADRQTEQIWFTWFISRITLLGHGLIFQSFHVSLLYKHIHIYYNDAIMTLQKYWQYKLNIEVNYEKKRRRQNKQNWLALHDNLSTPKKIIKKEKNYGKHNRIYTEKYRQRISMHKAN